jgi:glyoxylase-like metal-dependent hydrolase (beta-lactamase superfamily II)
VIAETQPVIRVVNGEIAANTYICRTATAGECVLIDPGLERDAVEAALIEAQLTPLAIFCTHGHFDHVGSAEYFRRKYDVDLHLHPADEKIARSSNFLMMALKMPERITVPEVCVPVEDGWVWASGPDRVEILHVPGHTPGSTVVLVNGRAFTGDTLYRAGAWVGTLPGADQARLVDSVRRLWTLLPDHTPIHPGHGGSAGFGEIKRSNTPLLEMLALAGE